MTAKELKASILDLAVRGKLVPQDPNDEPASVLLEKIRAEKQKLVKVGKIKKEKNPSEIYIASDGRPYEKFADGSEFCIEDEIPFELPKGWAWARLGTILTKLTDGTHVTPHYVERGVPFLSVKDISSGCLSFENCKFISQEEHAEFFSRCNPQYGDILLSKVGTTGIPVIVDCKEEFSIFVSIALLKFDRNIINDKFLLYLIQSPLVQVQAAENTKGVGNKNWVMRDIAHTLVVLPPLPEQHRIVATVEDLLPKVAEYENAELELSEFETKFHADLKRSILQSAVEGNLVPQDPKDEPASILVERIADERKSLIKAGKLKRDKHESVIFRGSDRLTYETRDGETVCIEDELPFKIPESWAWVRLNSLGTFVGGHTPSLADHTNWDNGNVIWITSKDMKSKYIVDSGEKLSAKGAKELQLLPPETILMVTRSGILKHTFPVAIAKKHLTINQDQRALRLYCPDMSEFVYVLLRGLESRILRDFVKKGTTVQSILWDKFINMPIPLPPLAEQLRIVAEVERLEAQVAQLQ